MKQRGKNNMIIMNKIIHRRYIAALKYIFIATSLITALIIVIQKGKNKMNKKEIADLLIKKQSINNIKELHDLYCSDEDIKNNNVRAYSWDCKTCGAEDIRCDLNGLVQTGDDPEFISIKDNNFWDGCEQRNDPNYE